MSPVFKEIISFCSPCTYYHEAMVGDAHCQLASEHCQELCSSKHVLFKVTNVTMQSKVAIYCQQRGAKSGTVLSLCPFTFLLAVEANWTPLQKPKHVMQNNNLERDVDQVSIRSES